MRTGGYDFPNAILGTGTSAFPVQCSDGEGLPDPDALNVVTLENAVYMGMKNDLAFVLEMGMYLYEHQSTYNPNIPLRDLFYIASEYQALADGKSLYSSGIQKIPTPKFLVFYNGLDHKVPDRMELRLSDAYENPVDEPRSGIKSYDAEYQCRT